jgi:hypothetical protein
MNNILYLNPSQLKIVYNSFNFYKPKDKICMVLEPLQSMMQIALLGISPIGTKLTIQENILYLQSPSLIQPLSRWYNADKKDDLYFLFQVIRRFIKWYNPNISRSSPLSIELYNLIIKFSIKGLDNLLQTYNTNDNNNIVQVISMYKNILQATNYSDIDQFFSDKGINLDEIFENITTIYSTEILSIFHNILLLLINEEDIFIINNIINGLNLIMYKNNKQIQTWIKINLML